MMKPTKTKPTTVAKMVTKAKIQFMKNMVKTTATKSRLAEITFPRLWLRDWPTVSTSLVTRDRVSP